MNTQTLTLTSEQTALARELGWADDACAEVQIAWLQCLLDDEFEQLPPAERGRLRSQLAAGVATESCGECGNVYLRRYRPDDLRCRVCAAPLGASAATAPSSRRTAGDAGSPPPLAWSPASLSVGCRVVLDAENEDWDDRRTRLQEQQAQVERRRRQVELAREQAEARRAEREQERQALTELIPPVPAERLGSLKRKAHAQIEERLAANRRKRRLLRGGKLRPR